MSINTTYLISRYWRVLTSRDLLRKWCVLTWKFSIMRFNYKMIIFFSGRCYLHEANIRFLPLNTAPRTPAITYQRLNPWKVSCFLPLELFRPLIGSTENTRIVYVLTLEKPALFTKQRNKTWVLKHSTGST